MKNASISGDIPDWLPNVFPNILYLELADNFFTGSIPDSYLTAFPNLVRLDLSNNLMAGHVPVFVSASLELLKLSGNHFSSNIPQQLCNLTSLQALSLADNQLIGRIPSCFGSLRSLTFIDVGNNYLSGHIPNEFGFLNQLWDVHMNGNRFSGELPVSLQNLTTLVSLDLGENELQGSIPRWIGKEWAYLQYLRLEGNKFSGEISVNLCQLPSLHILNLDLNNLVGTIPPCLGNVSMMLSDEPGVRYPSSPLLNTIKGLAMAYTLSLPYAKFISLSGNHLNGEIPVELMNLQGLQSLNLSNNVLTGMIPETINKLKLLESLDLSMNELSGRIPQSLADIDDLSYLNLSFNNLEGKVPSGNHFDTLDDPSIFQGNLGLCGKLLKKSYPGEDLAASNQPNGHVHGDDDEFDQLSWLYAGIGPGFAVGFLGVICYLFFKDEWRIAFFGFVDIVYNKVRVTFTMMINQFQSKFN